MNRGSEESFFLYHNFTPRRGDRSIARVGDRPGSGRHRWPSAR